MSTAAADPDAPLTGAAQSIYFSIATLFVALRLAVRRRQNRHFLADDYCIVWAWMCLVTMAGLQTRQLDALYYTTYLTAGRIPVGAETAARTEDLTRWQFPIIKLFWTVLWSVKASFMAVFYRLVKPSPVRRILWYCVAVFATLAYVGCWVASTLSCSPPSDYFKAGSQFAFSLAVVVICVAVVRMTQVLRGQHVDLVGLAVWGAVETATAVVVGSLLPLKSFLARGVASYHSSASKGGGGGSSSKRRGIRQSQPGGAGTYVPDTTSRSVVVTQSIPLDDLHRSRQTNGRIYVQTTYETHTAREDSSRDDNDEAAIVRSQANSWPA
ncbi:hypothetical protein LX36DRAFT_710897 [Colletotrichum falcatum]|nr:hypothetical protein LX36DRAFT_710897 [Colletotrichum falcatum]